MCKPHYGNYDFSPLANGVYLRVIINKTPLRNGNCPITGPIKVVSLLEASFDLISGSSLSMKIQIMGGKITENLGFKSPLWKVKNFCSFFLFIFKFFPQN